MEIHKINEEVQNLINPLILAAKIEGQKHYLGISGLRIGSEVGCRFTCSHGTSKQSYLTSVIVTGVITEMPDGQIKVLSKEPLKESRNVSNGRSGRSRRDWWEYHPKIMTSELKDIRYLQPSEKYNQNV